jgi:hypothetical protein
MSVSVAQSPWLLNFGFGRRLGDVSAGSSATRTWKLWRVRLVFPVAVMLELRGPGTGGKVEGMFRASLGLFWPGGGEIAGQA